MNESGRPYILEHPPLYLGAVGRPRLLFLAIIKDEGDVTVIREKTCDSVTQTLRSKARPASLQTGEMQNAPHRSSGTERAGTTKSKPLTASGGQKLTFAA